MKAKSAALIAAALLLAACDYCPRPGVLTWAPYNTPMPKPVYPMPNLSPDQAVPCPANGQAR